MSSSRENRRLLYEQLVGQTVGGRYHIVRLMGFGGMGAVYEAIQQNMNRRVALKYIPSHDPVTAARFEREALTVSQLRHPNTVTVFDYGQTNDGFLYLSMEMCVGRTLTELIRDESPLSPQRVVHIASQICRSLAEAHQMGIVHRDIKPDNVILIEVDGDPDVVKVLDFGIAKAISGEDDVQLTGDGRIIGTPRYMSPEQILAEGVDHRSDIYSLGCIIFEMLCGAPPFQGSSTTALMISHAQDAPPPFAERLNEEVLQQIPLALEQVVRRAMAKSPAQRPQTTEELRHELEQALQAHFDQRPPIPTLPPASMEMAPLAENGEPLSAGAQQSSSVNKALVAAVAVIGLAVVGLGAVVLFGDLDSDDPGTIAQNDEPVLPDQYALLEEPSPDPGETEPPEVRVNDTIHVRIESTPAGAALVENDRVVGRTPFNISVSSDVDALNYLLRAEGYTDKAVDLEITAAPGEAQTFSYRLEPEPRAERPRQQPRRTQTTRQPRQQEPEETEPQQVRPSVPILDGPSPRIDRLD